MFTGIIQDIGEVTALQARAGDCRLQIAVHALDLARQLPGASIAVAGICLTAIELGAKSFAADVSRETLSATTAGEWRAGRRVNLEVALRAGDPLGGHIVSGHVDGVGELLSRWDDARSTRMQFRVPESLAPYMARKGSVCIDGVSLTVNEVEADRIDVNLVPHTLAQTTLSGLQPGERVNVEVDMLARYVARLYEMMRA